MRDGEATRGQDALPGVNSHATNVVEHLNEWERDGMPKRTE
jgi:hypothetical protein